MAQAPHRPRRSRVSTKFLRIPQVDWAAVVTGHKTELRRVHGKAFGERLHGPAPGCLVLPEVAVGWRKTRVPAGHEYRLLVIEEVWEEPLGAISPESLEREGCSSIEEFRRYWNGRERHPFPPLATAVAWRFHPLPESERADAANRIFQRLYGRFDV